MRSHHLPLAASLFVACALALPSQARAEGFFVFPELGLSAGQLKLDGTAHNALQLDFNIGGEWSRGSIVAVGGMLHLGVMEILDRSTRPGGTRFSLAPLVTLSAGYGDLSPFARVGAGPLMGWTSSDLNRSTRLGGGLMVEGAVGLKSIFELFVTTVGALDAGGPSGGYTLGFRLNALVALDLFGDHGFFFGRHRSSRHLRGSGPRTPAAPPRPSGPHRAVPANAG